MPSSGKLSFGGIQLTAGEGDGGGAVRPETPFRLLIGGDFSGDRADRVALPQRKPIRIDRDNFDDVLAKVGPRVTLAGVGDAEISIAFQSLEDLEPDRLYASLPIFTELRELQEQLGNPTTFAQAAAKVRAWANLPEPAPDTAKAPSSGGELLANLLGEDPSQAAPAQADDWQRFLESKVRPQLVAKPDPRQADYEAVVDEAISARMRALLHHPKFQRLESAWRGVHLLVKRLPTDETLQLFLLDGRTDEWRGDLAQSDPQDSAFVRILTTDAADRPWAAFVNLETFGRGVDDLQALGSMLLVCAHVRTPLLASASSLLYGCPSLASSADPRAWKPDTGVAEAWKMIRGLAQSRYLGMVTPRILLRLPYGKDAAETESFRFEEMPTPEHAHYLWGSGAVLIALMLGEGFAAAGWDLDPSDIREVHGLPLHVYQEDGAPTVKPCAEVHLREAALEAIVERGLMVLISQRDRDGVRLSRWQSASPGNEALAGRW